MILVRSALVQLRAAEDAGHRPLRWEVGHETRRALLAEMKRQIVGGLMLFRDHGQEQDRLLGIPISYLDTPQWFRLVTVESDTKEAVR